MRNILFETCPLTSLPLPTPAPQITTTRRLLSITMALQLSGAPPPDTATQVLLVRYVAGKIPLADILPALWQV